jgi:hypothetical protein
MVCELIQQSWTFPLIAYAATLVVMGVIALVALATEIAPPAVPRGQASTSSGRRLVVIPTWE